MSKVENLILVLLSYVVKYKAGTLNNLYGKYRTVTRISKKINFKIG